MTEPLGGTYSIGTVSILETGNTFTGTGTFWASELVQGDWIYANGVVAIINNDPITNTSCNVEAWTGGELTNVPYVAVKMSWLRYDPAITQQKVRDLIALLTTVGDVKHFTNTTEATGAGTVYSARFDGGVEIAKKLYVTGQLHANSGVYINGDLILRHPLTPSPDNVPDSIICLGSGAGASVAPIHSTQYLTLAGKDAGNLITTADHITAMGAFACAAYTVSTAPSPFQPSLTAIGIDSMRALTTGYGNSALGEHTMTDNTTISLGVAVGVNAMFFAGGFGNVALGPFSIQSVAAPNRLTGTYNVGAGFSTLAQLSLAAGQNTAVGGFAGSSITIGSLNLCLGYGAGGTVLTTGVGNILIGTNVTVPTSGTNNYLNIANVITGALSGTTGITITGTLAVSSTLTVTGATTHTGATTLSAAITYGGVTLANAVTGTGNMVLSVAPTFTGTIACAALTASGTISGVAVATSGLISTSLTTQSTTSANGALTVAGGVGITKVLNVGAGIGVGNTYGVRGGGINAIEGSNTGQFILGIVNTHGSVGDSGVLIAAGASSATDASTSMLTFYNSALSSVVGNITRNGTSSVAYGTASDIRGKPNRELLSLSAARSIVDSLKIWDFDKDGNAIRGIGVLAQEAYEVYKPLASPGQTPEQWWSAEKAGPVPFLVANMQQANKRLDEIERKLAA